MASLAVTMKGQVTLKRDLLQHLGIEPGERVVFEKLPGGELRVHAARPLPVGPVRSENHRGYKHPCAGGCT
jgi:bifunctional DNA-binding transcriptional regulator/antitoxin component of YhaV-PrlF toxin-antitoxin module